jgi:hypothetical protein
MVIIFALCDFFKYWAGLYKKENAGKIREGAQVMVNKAPALVGNLHLFSDQPTTLMMEGPWNLVGLVWY